MKRTLSLSQVYRLLEPGPVTLVTTARGGQLNVMTQSWHTMIEFEPPIVGCVISIPTVELAAKWGADPPILAAEQIVYRRVNPHSRR